MVWVLGMPSGLQTVVVWLMVVERVVEGCGGLLDVVGGWRVLRVAGLRFVLGG